MSIVKLNLIKISTPSLCQPCQWELNIFTAQTCFGLLSKKNEWKQATSCFSLIKILQAIHGQTGHCLQKVNNAVLTGVDGNLQSSETSTPRAQAYLLMCPMAVLIVTRGPPSSALSTYGGNTSSSSTTGSMSASPVSTDLEHLFLKI